MTDQRDRAGTGDIVAPRRVFWADSLAHTLLAVAARAVARRDCADLAALPLLGRYRGMPAAGRRLAAAGSAELSALPAERVGDVDAQAVAGWVVGHYPTGRYPAVVLGSPHGGAVHLAAALGAAWLPTGFPMAVRWPGGAVDDPAAALAHGAPVQAALAAANPQVTVRQSHDPVTAGVVAGATVSLTVRWRRLPRAYREFLTGRLNPQAPVLVARDARTWPVLRLADGQGFQVGGVAGGLEPDELRHGAAVRQLLPALGGDPRRWQPPGGAVPTPGEHGVEAGFEAELRDWARGNGSPVHRVVYPDPAVLSAAVADVLRGWLRRHGGSGAGCAVDCASLLDPVRVTAAGLVPYWCEAATRAAVAGAEWWLAGSQRFATVDVLPAPPGVVGPASATLAQWRAVASFGRLRGQVDRTAARSYPLFALPTSHATRVFRDGGFTAARLAPLRITDALAGLRDSGVGRGLLVC